MTDEHITAVQLDEAIRGLTAHDLAALHARTPVDVADQQVAAHIQAAGGRQFRNDRPRTQAPYGVRSPTTTPSGA
jgi:hypothetical protein